MTAYDTYTAHAETNLLQARQLSEKAVQTGQAALADQTDSLIRMAAVWAQLAANAQARESDLMVAGTWTAQCEATESDFRPVDLSGQRGGPVEPIQ
ncbi:hypothetical protein ACTVZO_45300 [Streptomyces sp. IBSNAI002]|uniref:hypothetical protein n=1 Tax=Streptomyces sp. IBSNAI002 TaxID=3457500 RepID=UPI003FD652C5